jgi:ADP-ribose pyrophosphatase
MTAKKSTKTSQTGTEAVMNGTPEQKAAAVPSPSKEIGKAQKAGSAQKPAGRAKTAKKSAKAKSPAKTEIKTEGEAAENQVTESLAAAPEKAAKPAKVKAEKMLDSQVAYEGPLFRVLRDHFIEPDGKESHRDVIRHNGSVVILAIDPGKKKKDPWVVLERQYRHAAGQYLWELPAGKLEKGEAGLDGAKRELTEETGYQAKKWSTLMTYYASPGFLGESMTVFLAEGLIAGDAHPEDDEEIEMRLVKLSELLEMVDKGKIIDGKTLSSALFYARQLGLKRKH